MRRALATVAGLALSAAGCCGPTFGEGSRLVVRDNAAAWRLASQYAAAAGWPGTQGLPGDVAPSTPVEGATWRARYVVWLANAFLLDARAQGGTMTLRDALAAAEAEVPR